MSLVVFYWDMKLFEPLTGYTVCKDHESALRYLSEKGGAHQTALQYEMTNSVSRVRSLREQWSMTFPEMRKVSLSFLDMAEHEGWTDLIPDDTWQLFHY